MTSVINKNVAPAFQSEYFDRFERSFGFSLREINLPRDCQLIQPVEIGIFVAFSWNQIDRKVQVLENSFIRVIDIGIRIKWQQSVLTSELLTNLLRNINLGVLQACESELAFPIIDCAKVLEIQEWMEAEDNNANVVTKFQSNIPRSEIKHLDWRLTGSSAWLSDDIIDYYFLLMNERNESKGLPKTYSMPANIWTFYSKHGYEAVLKRVWMKTFRLNFDILLIPICESSVKHWCLATVDLRLQTIRYFDSLNFGNAENSLNKVFEFLNFQSQRENKCELNLNEWNLEIATNIPKQENDYDCGVFCCQFAEFISRDRQLNFEQNDMKYFRQKMLYEIYREEMLN